MSSLAVLVTYHNEGPLLTECLRSVLDQRERPDEVVVYDDASGIPAAAFVPEGSGVRVIRGERNVGPARGRNALLCATAADYVHFHDADDLFAPTWAARVRAVIRDAAPDVVLTEIRSETEGRARSECVLGLRRLAHEPDLVRFCLSGAVLPASGTYRRALVQGIGGYDERLWQSEDYDFHVRLALAATSYQWLPDALVTIRVRQESRSQDRLSVWRSAVQAVRQLTPYVPSSHRDHLAEAAARFGSHLYRLGARSDARRAFRLAREVGKPCFRYDSRLFHLVARSLGPMAAEALGAAYRHGLPERLRTRLTSRPEWATS